MVAKIKNLIQISLIWLLIYIMYIGILNPYQSYCGELNCMPTLTLFYFYCIFVSFLHGIGIFIILKIFTNLSINKIILFMIFLIIFSIIYKFTYINISLANLFLLLSGELGKIISIICCIYFIKNREVALKIAYGLFTIFIFIFIVSFLKL